MTRRNSVLLSLVLVLGVALSALSVSVPAAKGTGEFNSGQDHAPEPSSPLLLDQSRLNLGDVGSELDVCGGSLSIPLRQSDLCTHGPDPAPPGFDVDEPVDPLRSGVARQAMAAAPCDGDGQSGFRLQVLYVHGADVTSRYDRFRLSIQGWAAEMDQIFQASAAETGGARSLRFVHDADCLPIVEPVQVSPAGDGSFDTTIAELKNRRYNRTDRMYLAFVDTTAAGLCGIGTVWSDDRANGRANRNNIGPAYSRVDAGCWSGDIAAHEVMHNLGGVQHSAPNGSGAFHCIDEWDLMCYQDGSGASTREECPNRARDMTRFDCNHDDYFHTHPPAGSYLANHWNSANNRFLIGSPSLAAEDAKKPNKAKKGKKDKKKHGNKKHKGGNGKRR